MRLYFSSIACSSLMMMMSVGACTFFSGVEELELRKNGADAGSTSSSSSSSGSTESETSPTTPLDASAIFGDGSGLPTFPSLTDSGGGGTTKPIKATPGPQLCGAAGTWTECAAANTTTSCAERCLARGLSCVDSCCAYDTTQGDYPAKIGQALDTLGLECQYSSVSTQSTLGLCADPVLPMPASSVRCCCK